LGWMFAVCAPYRRTQPAGYQVITGACPKVTEDVPLVHIGLTVGELEPDGTENTSSPTIVSNTSFTAP
jgi:hypothetical protein